MSSSGSVLHTVRFDSIFRHTHGVCLHALGKPHDLRPRPVPAVHGEASGTEGFNVGAVQLAEAACRGGIVIMRVGFVPEKIARIDGAFDHAPGYQIPGTSSWRLGADETNKADVLWLNRSGARRLGLGGVGFFGADPGFCQIAVFYGGEWCMSYFVHVEFHNLAPKSDPQGMSLIEAVAAHIRRHVEQTGIRGYTMKMFYGLGISPQWYGVDETHAQHLRARYGDDGVVGILHSGGPHYGPRKSGPYHLSLFGMLDAELTRTKLAQTLQLDVLAFENVENCPAGMRTASGEPALWSAVRESGTPGGNANARNLIVFNLPDR